MVAIDLDVNGPESSLCKTFDQSLVERANFCQETNFGGFAHYFDTKSILAWLSRESLHARPLTAELAIYHLPPQEEIRAFLTLAAQRALLGSARYGSRYSFILFGFDILRIDTVRTKHDESARAITEVPISR